MCSRDWIDADRYGLERNRVKNFSPMGQSKNFGMAAYSVYNEFSDGIPFEDYEVKFLRSVRYIL
jgi:hypothetical protein